jgi:hypothetical protein
MGKGENYSKGFRLKKSFVSPENGEVIEEGTIYKKSIETPVVTYFHRMIGDNKCYPFGIGYNVFTLSHILGNKDYFEEVL